MEQGKLLDVVLLVYDRHKRDVDLSSIKGYCDASSAVTDDLFKIIEDYKVTKVIEMGDLYDRGYTKIGAQYVDMMDEIALRDLVEGEYYGLLGNHLMLERDNNPEFYLIQPNSYKGLKPLVQRKFRQQVIKVVDELIIGNTQISFFHYSKDDKNYVNERKPGIKYHVGLYHDDTVVPNSVRQQCGIKSKVTSDYLNHIYSNVDFAFLAHIHTKLGMLKLRLKTGRIIPAYIQGALAMTSSKDSEYHESVSLPLLYIYENDLIVKFVKVSLHTELMKIHKEKSKIEEGHEDRYVAVPDKKRFKIDASDVIKIEVCDSISQYLNMIDETGQQLALFNLALEKDITELEIDKILSGQNTYYLGGVEVD